MKKLIKSFKNFVNSSKHNKKSRSLLMSAFSSVLLLLSVTFAWFVSTINLNGTVKVNGTEIGTSTGGGGIDVTTGAWTPTLSSSAISSYTTRTGWYQKAGVVVTVGFIIKATCNSGYHSTQISISGLPYEPLYAASGGGICAGAYITVGGFTFECWVANTDGTINARVQSPASGSVAGNMLTSASGLTYRSGGGEITLGGTITYVTV